MERGVVVGGLMICGSFLLAVLLNRSAMEEPPAPATIAVPRNTPASGAKVAPATVACAKVDSPSPSSSTALTAAEPKPSPVEGCADSN